MKRTYIMPTILVEMSLVQEIICTSMMNNVDGNAGLDYGGGGSDDARTKEESGSWDIDW